MARGLRATSAGAPLAAWNVAMRGRLCQLKRHLAEKAPFAEYSADDIVSAYKIASVPACFTQYFPCRLSGIGCR
jgi:hypothetical protein